MMKSTLALSLAALSLVAGASTSAHMTKSHAAMMKQCHRMSHAAMMKNPKCAAMMKAHMSSMGSHSMMKKGDMMDKGAMSGDMMGNTSTPKK